jgi:propane monooxygenase reductase subunit
MCYPQSDLVLATGLGGAAAAPIGQHDTVVREILRRGPAVYEIIAEADAPIAYRSGQYFDWVLPGIAPNRSYSAACKAGGRDVVFHVRAYENGKVSRYLTEDKLHMGDTLTLKGPYGSFGWGARTEAPAVMVAGGTGLAPIMALLEEDFASKSQRSIQLFYGAQRAQDLYHLKRLEDFAKKHARFKFFAAVADAQASPGWQGELGLVTDVMRRKLIDAMGWEAYLCGPPAMIDAASAVLEAKGVDQDDIHADRFVAVV